MRSALFVVPLLLAACAAAPVRVTGRYASSLSEPDVQQITTLVASRRAFGYPLREIIVVGRDRARVITRRTEGSKSWSGTSYFVVRRGASWVVDDPDGFEATTERIITSHSSQ
jgi:hypothetical protein